MKIESRHITLAHVSLASKLRDASIADKRTHICVEPLARESYNHRHRHTRHPPTTQHAGKIQQPELIADLDKIRLLDRQNPTQRALVGPCIQMRKHPPIARIDHRRTWCGNVMDAP